MRKIILLITILFNSYLFSQFQFIGSEEYGRIFSLTYDKNVENRVYALTQGNHILVSGDNGMTWDVLYSHPMQGELEQLKFISSENSLSFTSKNLGTHAFDPTELNYGLYIYDLESGVITKTFQLPGQAGSVRESIRAYSIWENDTDIALVVQDYIIAPTFRFSKVHYTTNGGETWAEVYYSGDNLDYFPDNVAISPDNSEKLFIARGMSFQESSGGLLISEDGGQNWTEKLPGICFTPITFHPENPQEIWLGSGQSSGNDHFQGLYKSSDGGETWNLIPIQWTPYIGDNIRAIEFNPSNLNNIIILEENEIVISNDGGESWELYTHPEADNTTEGYYDGRNVSFNPFNENEVFINSAFFPLFSTDKGISLQRLKTPFFREFGNVRYFNNGGSEHLYYGAQNGFVHQNVQNMEENGYGLIPLNSNSFVPNIMLHIDKNIEGRIYAFHPPFQLKVSNDHGETQNTILSVTKNECNAVSTLPDNQNIIYASLCVTGEEVEIQKIDFSNINAPQVTGINTPQANGRVMNIHFDTANSNNIIATQGGRVYRSANGGVTWSNSSNGLDILHQDSDLIMKLIQNPSNPEHFTIATSKGIFRSSDNGETWEQIHTSFSNNIAYSGQTIIATTCEIDGRQVEIVCSKDNGATWESIDGELFTPINLSNLFSSTDFYFYDNFVDIYIGTSGLGVLKHTLDLTTLKIINSELIGKKSSVIYPNPAKGIVNIQSTEEIKSVEIYSLSGQKILTSFSGQVDVSHLSKGIYIVKIQLQNGKTETHKLIKN